MCMACTVYVYGICLKCYVAVDVGECLSRCGTMEILSVQERKCSHLLGWEMLKVQKGQIVILNPLSLVLETLQNKFAYISNMYMFYFLCLADFALGR